VLVPLLLAMLALGGCALPWSRQPQPSGKAVVVLADFSASTAALRDFYLENVRQVLAQMDHGDFLAVCRITASSVNEPGVLLQEEFAPFVPRDAAGNPTDNPVLVRQAREKADAALAARKAALEEEARRAWLGEPGREKIMRTDIMGSLTVAQNLFAAHRRDRSVLVVLSDMLEDSERYNFTRESLSEKRIEEIITAERGARRLPRLQGVKVYVVAPGTGDTSRFFAVRNFWLKYFAACGAELPAENYGNKLPTRI
jgi:hypothetical protein